MTLPDASSSGAGGSGAGGSGYGSGAGGSGAGGSEQVNLTLILEIRVPVVVPLRVVPAR
jgi:hypothetical protein